MKCMLGKKKEMIEETSNLLRNSATHLKDFAGIAFTIFISKWQEEHARILHATGEQNDPNRKFWRSTIARRCIIYSIMECYYLDEEFNLKDVCRVKGIDYSNARKVVNIAIEKGWIDEICCPTTFQVEKFQKGVNEIMGKKWFKTTAYNYGARQWVLNVNHNLEDIHYFDERPQQVDVSEFKEESMRDEGYE